MIQRSIAPLLATLLAATPIAAALTSPLAPLQQAELERGADDLAQVLLDTRLEPVPTTDLARRLAACDRPLLARLFRLLQEGQFDVRIGERGNSQRSITQTERAALVLSFGSLDWGDVLRFLVDLRSEEPDSGQRLAALAILGAHGTSLELTAITSWGSAEEGERRIPMDVRGAFAGALEALLLRHPELMDSMPEHYQRAPLSLVPSVLNVVGRHPSREGLLALSGMLKAVPRADPLVLAEIGHVGEHVPHPVEEVACARVRTYLDSLDSTLLVEAIVAVGKLEDRDVLQRLFLLLEHELPHVRERALESLQLITGQRHGPDPVRWRNWHEKALAWWQERASAQLESVTHGPPAQASRAIMELSRRRFFRHQIAEPLSRGLGRSEESLIVLTCAALGSLGSSLCVPDLLLLLDHPSLDVRQAAFLALRRITGEDHGEHSQDWAQAGW